MELNLFSVYTVDLSIAHIPPYSHFQSHAYTLPPQATLTFLLTNVDSNINFCYSCSKPIHTEIGLLVHDLVYGHTPDKIWCSVCATFIILHSCSPTSVLFDNFFCKRKSKSVEKNYALRIQKR